MSEKYELKPIGIIHSPFTTGEEIRNSDKSQNIGEIEIYKEFEDGLEDIEGFSHIVIMFWLHKSEFQSLKVQPIYHPEVMRGVFSTLHPNRPNPIGISIVELLDRNKNILRVKGIDMFDKTPVLDIKPYTKSYQKEITKFGWMGSKYPNAET